MVYLLDIDSIVTYCFSFAKNCNSQNLSYNLSQAKDLIIKDFLIMNETHFQQAFENLNEAQQAVETIYWPVMVIAWPGTGRRRSSLFVPRTSF